MRKTLFLLVLFVLIVPTCTCIAQNSGVRLVSGGEYKDKDGSIHAWKINGAHTLIWDGKPYLPVGGVFYSKYVNIGQTDENWQADVRALDLLKGKGISDLILKSMLPITWTKPEAWQKLTDYLDGADFTYGIDLADGPTAPLDGFIVDPTRYRVGGIAKSTTLTFDMPDTIAGVWMLGRARDGNVVSTGGAAISNGKVTLNVKAPAGENCVLLFYPVKELSNVGVDGVSDLWGGFDEYRDRLVGFTSAVKFGKGLRFFVDPVSSKMDFTGERELIIPDSAEFRLEFEAYLTKKYSNIGTLSNAWSIKSDHVESFEQAARLIPLWHESKGVPAIYDRARAKRFSVDTTQSKIWDDIITFRDSSAQSYLNSAADLVKRNAGNVPVIYRAQRYHRIYANSVSSGGFDGLGTDAYGHGESLVADYAGPIYSLAEDSARSTWFIITGTQDVPWKNKPTPGYTDKETLIADLDSLAEIGAKGIFVNGLQVLPEEKWKNHSLALFPEQIDWLKSFKDKFIGNDRTGFAPQVVYYPTTPIVGGEVTRIAPNTWWLPSLKAGSSMYFGDTVGVYTVQGQEGICIWSRAGNATISFPTTAADNPKVIFPSNAQDVLTLEKKRAVLKLSGSPIVLAGLDPLHPFPTETAEAEVAKLGPLVTRAKAATLSVAPSEAALTSAQQLIKVGETARAYDKAHMFNEQLRAALGSYIWIEGEFAISNFDGVFQSVGASSGCYLKLNTDIKPPVTPYTASFSFQATKESNHEIWLAGLALESGISPFSYCIDNGEWEKAIVSEPLSRYGKHFAWYKIGVATLSVGVHTIQIRVDSPNQQGDYHLDIDAIVLSPSEFKPDGIKKP